MIRFFSEERGAMSIEYALIATIISIAIVTSMSQWSDSLGDLFAHIQDAFTPPQA